MLSFAKMLVVKEQKILFSSVFSRLICKQKLAFSCFMMSNSVALPKLNERTQIWKFFHFVGNYNSSREYLTISFTHMLLVTSVFLTFWFLYFLMGRGEVILHVKYTLVEKMRLTVVFCLSHFVRVLPRKLINSTTQG